MSYSTIFYPVKMEYGSKNNIFGLKMMVKSSLEIFILKSLHTQTLFWTLWFTSWKGGFVPQITNSVIKMTSFAHGGISIKIFVMHVSIINETLSHKFYPGSILAG